MQKFINNPQAVVDEMLEGFVKAHGDLVANTDNERVLKYRKAPVAGKVGIVTGGGSGHKPAFIGYIGKNMADAVAVERAGAFSLVLEAIPLKLAKEITKTVKIPTIGIGAGLHCDGQVLVIHDLLGLSGKLRPKFVKQYAHLETDITRAVKAFLTDVKKEKFPTDKQSFH